MLELSLIEIKGKEAWIEHGKIIQDSLQEAKRLIAKENISVENVFLISIDNKDYLAFYTEGESKKIEDNSDLLKKHRELLRGTRMRRIDGQLLYSVDLREI